MKWQVSFLPPQGNCRLIMFLYPTICIKIELSPHRHVACHYIEWLHSSGKYLYSYLPPHTPTKKRPKYVYLSKIKLNWRIKEATLQHTACWAYMAELGGTASSCCHGHESSSSASIRGPTWRGLVTQKCFRECTAGNWDYVNSQGGTAFPTYCLP